MKLPLFDTYRISSFQSVMALDSNIEEPECPEDAENSNNLPDLLFKNNAAKKAYLSWIGVKVESGSILELARLDAWIFTWLEITWLESTKQWRSSQQIV